MGEVFAAAPFVVGERAAPGAPIRTSRPRRRCRPVVANDWVNDEYKHLVLEASAKALAAKAGQFFNWLCPSPDDGDLWLRRPQSVYRVDRAGPHRIPLQMRRTRHPRPGDARSRATRSTSSGRSASASGSIRRGATSSCSGAASDWRRWRRSRSWQASRCRRDRDPLGAQPRSGDDRRSFRQVGDVVPVLDSDGSSASPMSRRSSRGSSPRAAPTRSSPAARTG